MHFVTKAQLQFTVIILFVSSPKAIAQGDKKT